MIDDTYEFNEDFGLKTLTLSQLEAIQFPEAEWLVEGLLPVGALALLVGRPKAGKSLLAIDLLASIANGEDFLGLPTEPGGSLYVPAEDALSLVRDRLFTRLGSNRDAPLSVLPADGSLDQSIRLDIDESVIRFGKTVAAIRPHLLVLDPFRELHRKPENEAEAMADVLRPLRYIAHKAGCTIILIHHRNKHATDPSLAIRGSSAIAGAVDLTITMDTVAEGPDFEAGQLLMLNVEGRYGARKRFGARLGDNLRWEAVEINNSSSPQSAADRVLRMLQASASAMTGDQLARETGLAKKTIQNAFGSLRASGKIDRLGNGAPGDPYRYKAVRDERPDPQAAPAEQPTFDPF